LPFFIASMQSRFPIKDSCFILKPALESLPKASALEMTAFEPRVRKKYRPLVIFSFGKILLTIKSKK
jgi:hypothetical protein